MEHEVTVREYFEFLNDPATLEAIDAAEEPILYPRETQGPHCRRGRAGRA